MPLSPPRESRPIRAGLEAQLLEGLGAHGARLPREEALAIFNGDLELNAQGLGVRLDGQARA